MTIRIVLFALLLAHPSHALPTHATKAMVTSASHDATRAGVAILEKGGNAVDAAVATAFAISVVEPYMAGIGGGGFLLFYSAKNKEVKALDFREKAPSAATKKMYQGTDSAVSSTKGPFSVAVPGTVAGLYEVHRKHGKLPWRTLIEPAILLAKNGFGVDAGFVENFASQKEALKKNAAAWRIFSKANQTDWKEGDILKQPDLAKTLENIAKDPSAFYSGSIASSIVADMRSQKGLMSADDLRSYKPTWRDPLCGEFMHLQVCSMPPPSSGGIVLMQMLNMVKLNSGQKLLRHEPETLNFLTHAMRSAYQDRANYLGDPAFVSIEVDKLTSLGYARERLGRLYAVSNNAPPKTPTESSDTTHLNVVDKDKNAVSLTFTVNLGFGSGVVAGNTGVLLNDEMDDFTVDPNKPNAFGLRGSEANCVAPGKIPLSSMTPTIALSSNKELRFLLGAPGGSRIITTVFEVMLNHLVFGMNIADAISARRFHHQWSPDEISLETNALDPTTIAALEKMGNKVTTREHWSNANMINVRPDGSLEGAIDPRGTGLALGVN